MKSNKVQQREKKRRLKLEVVKRYGGKCACCGEANVDFLCLDHVNDNGNVERFSLGGRSDWGGQDLYYRVRKRGYPPDYQLLCFNCNNGRWFNAGICPHKGIRTLAERAEFSRRIAAKRSGVSVSPEAAVTVRQIIFEW